MQLEVQWLIVCVSIGFKLFTDISCLPALYARYGGNVVVQLQGTKRWLLYPPGDSGSMYLTRIPYEESSVFSMVSVTNPDHSKFPRFSENEAVLAVVEAGDVLVIPRHWWHDVRFFLLLPWTSSPTVRPITATVHESSRRALERKLVMH